VISITLAISISNKMSSSFFIFFKLNGNSIHTNFWRCIILFFSFLFIYLLLFLIITIRFLFLFHFQFHFIFILWFSYFNTAVYSL
jgi:hypothetical protein